MHLPGHPMRFIDCWATFSEGRSDCIVHATGAISLAGWGLLALRSRTPGEATLTALLLTVAAAWLALATAWFAARRLPPRRTLRALWLWALLIRVAAFFGEPLLEDDWARYLWDGRQFALTGNPYASAPARHFADAALPEKFQGLLDQINNPELPTIYGPVCETAFLASYLIAPGELWPLKLFLLAADLALLRLLLNHTSPRYALLYAWSPLLIQESAFTAHPELLWIAPVFAGLHFTVKRKPMLAALFCGIACGAKIVALLMVPFVLVRLGRRYWTVALATTVACYAWFWFQGSAADFPALRAMSANWEFNSFLFALIRVLTGHSTAVVLAATIYGAIWLALFSHDRTSRPTFPRGDLVYGCFFLCSAVVNPWYLLAMVAFLPLYPALWGATAVAIIPLSYAHGLNLSGATYLAPYQLPLVIRWVEGCALLVALCAAVWLRRHSQKSLGD